MDVRRPQSDRSHVAQHAALAAPLGGRVFPAGEATDLDWHSYVHRASLSGIRAANEL